MDFIWIKTILGFEIHDFNQDVEDTSGMDNDETRTELKSMGGGSIYINKSADTE